MIYRRFGKRVFDLAVGVPVLIASSPLLIVCAALVKISSPGPVLFVQKRLGRHGLSFLALKFRTMVDVDREGRRTEVFDGNQEVTYIGRFLRRFKIDELPQVFNVVTGDMSIVGPRPPLPEQIEEYDEISRRRLEVRPGLTGLAQTHGNIYLSWSERWEYDVEYVERLSLGLDLWIIWRTLGVLLRGEQAYLPSTAQQQTTEKESRHDAET